jgi:hypothetical protein
MEEPGNQAPRGPTNPDSAVNLSILVKGRISVVMLSEVRRQPNTVEATRAYQNLSQPPTVHF